VSNLYLEPFFPNDIVLHKIPKNFFTISNNLGEPIYDSGSDLYHELDFSEAFFERGGYQKYMEAYLVYREPEESSIKFHSRLLLVKIIN
jgi:hypothetical protein